ncbi:hybrid sensor histidine kinase/response regulator [Thiovibrio sp. JS02]
MDKNLPAVSRGSMLPAVLLLSGLPFLLAGLFPSLGQFTIEPSRYLIFHNVAEFFSIMAFFSIFGLGWFSHEQSRDTHALFLSAAFLVIGLVDFLHTMSYAGMPDFFTPNSPNKSTQFWIAARLFSGLAFFASSCIHQNTRRLWLCKPVLLPAAFSFCACVFATVIFFPDALPATFVEGVGLTPFKKGAEYLIIALFLAAAFSYWRRWRKSGERLLLLFVAALLISAASELAFAAYQSAFDTYNVLGHLYKIIAGFFFYRGIFVSTIATPYRNLLASDHNLRQEVRERGEAEAALRESEAFLNSVIENIPDMIFVKEAKELRFVRFNRAGEELLGYPRQTMIGKNDHDLFPAAEADLFTAKDREVLAGGEVVDIPEETILTRDKGERILHTKKMPLLDDNGNAAYLLGISEDITERKKAEEVLARAAAEWSAAMDASDDAIYLLDLDRRLLRANKAFYRLTGSSEQSAIGRHITSIIHPQGEKTPCPVCQAQDAQTDALLTMEADHPDNPTGKPIEVSVKVVRNQAGKPVSILMSLHDLSSSRKIIAERAALEAQLRQAQKIEALGTLAGGIAHDFNNILTPILGYSELTLENLPPESPLRQDLAQVITAANRAKELIKNILTFSRQREHDLLPLRLQYVVKEALKLLRASIPATIEIRQDIAPDCEPVLADPVQVHQVIMNLCTNAYHAMRDTGGTLTISLQQVEQPTGMPTGSYLRLEVRDTGPGIPASLRERIFEPYFTTKAKEEGTGLGLAIVRNIVKNLHGEVMLETSPGQGASFVIFLPTIHDAGPAEQSPAVALLPRGTERILLVDDEEVVLKMERKLLERLGYTVHSFSGGQEALAAFRDNPDAFDLVITDITMPKLTGKDLAREILALRPRMPIVMCTGFSQLVNAEEAQALGVRQFIMKPVIMSDFAVAVRKALLDG